MCITPRATIFENINELQAKVYEFDDDNDPVPDNIPDPETQQDTPTYKPWGWGGIDCRKAAGNQHERDRVSEFVE